MESPFGYYDCSATVQAACYDGLVDSLMTRFIRRIGLCAKICDEIGAVGERRSLDLFSMLALSLKALSKSIGLAVAKVTDRSREMIPITFFMRFSFMFLNGN